MIVSINQPAYLPWLGYFQRIAVSDLHVVLDHVQFAKNSFTNRNKIRTREGWMWLSVPLSTSGRFGALQIDQLEIANNSRWMEKQWAAIRSNYSKTPYFSAHAPFFEKAFGSQWDRLNPLMREITRYLLDTFEIKTPLVFTSEMPAFKERKNDLIFEICDRLKADVYLSGTLGRNYLNEETFTSAGMRVAYQDYKHPQYAQAHPGFEPYMAAIDILFNHGPESLKIMCSDNPTRDEMLLKTDRKG